MTEEFNLSKKMDYADGLGSIVYDDDVKEFIKKIKGKKLEKYKRIKEKYSKNLQSYIKEGKEAQEKQDDAGIVRFAVLIKKCEYQIELCDEWIEHFKNIDKFAGEDLINS